MKKDNSKQASTAEQPVSEISKAADHHQLPEAPEHGGDAGHEILQQEYNESAKLLDLSQTTEKTLVINAEKQGKQPDDVISAYLHEQLPNHNFYDQPVLLGT